MSYSQMSVLTSFGMQPAGFKKPLLADIRAAMNDQYRQIYGTPNVQDGSRIGTRIGITAKLLADSWEGAEAAYNAPFPSKADDTSFADVMDLVDLQMLPASKTQVILSLTVSSDNTGTVTIPAGYTITDPSGIGFACDQQIQQSVTAHSVNTIVGSFSCVQTGPIEVPESQTWTYTQPDGIGAGNSVTAIANGSAGSTGRNAETPAEARLRRAQSLRVVGAGAVDAIVARVRNNVANVTGCRGFENDDDVADAVGRPPHSIEIMVTNGTDADIAAMLWSCKAGGISFYGNTSAVVVDSQGNNQTVLFTRPAPVPMAVEVTITRYSEEQLPADYENIIIAAVKAYAAAFNIGQDMLIDRWLGPVYAACSGVDKITIRQAINGGGWQTDDIAVDYNKYPGTVTVTVVGP
jgi:uncharacterized phage protein gp47/JayE